MMNFRRAATGKQLFLQDSNAQTPPVRIQKRHQEIRLEHRPDAFLHTLFSACKALRFLKLYQLSHTFPIKCSHIDHISAAILPASRMKGAAVMKQTSDKYEQILLDVFFENYQPGSRSVLFSRNDLISSANRHHFSIGNYGDIVYMYKYRRQLPKSIRDCALQGTYWRLRNVGTGKYEFVLAGGEEFIEPDLSLEAEVIHDSSPAIVKAMRLDDEQSLLAQIRYNHLISIFTGTESHTLQSHLRTSVKGVGQVETDEIYVGSSKEGECIIPVQAKRGKDKIGLTQIEQDFLLCKEKFGSMRCRAIACQFMEDAKVAFFEFACSNGIIRLVQEKHYQLEA